MIKEKALVRFWGGGFPLSRHGSTSKLVSYARMWAHSVLSMCPVTILTTIKTHKRYKYLQLLIKCLVFAGHFE